MVCVKLAVYLLYGVAIWVWLTEKTRDLAPAALRSHVQKPCVEATWLDILTSAHKRRKGDTLVVYAYPIHKDITTYILFVRILSHLARHYIWCIKNVKLSC